MGGERARDAVRTAPGGRVRTRHVLAAASVAVVLGLAGCGGATAGSTASGASASVAAAPSAIATLPRLPEMRPLSSPTLTSDGTVQSFAVSGLDPRTAIETYAGVLHGWVASEPPHPVGATDWRAQWVEGDRRLTASTSPAPTVARAGSGVHSELTLRLDRIPTSPAPSG